MKITEKKIIHSQQTIDVNIEVEGTIYLFRIRVSENAVLDISHRDRWSVALRPSTRKKIEQLIREEFGE